MTLACEVSGVSLFVLNACLLILMHILEGESQECVQEGSCLDIWRRCTFCAKNERTAEGRTATDLSSGYFLNK